MPLMRAPSFWWDARPSLAARLLSPFGLLYGIIAGKRMVRTGHRASARIICIGNLTVGGAGKTPVAMTVANLLQRSHRPAFLTRGYGGTEEGPVLVDPQHHDARLVGDEPLLLARLAPTVVARNRVPGLRLLEGLERNVVIMDDGLQNPSLAKDLRIAVIDAAIGIGNGLCLPAGPLRAPLASQWALIDALVLMGSGTPGEALVLNAVSRGLPVFRARFALSDTAIHRLASRRVLAYAGIGRPQKFFDSLNAAGIDVRATMGFPDHHVLTGQEAAAVLRHARKSGLTPVTTEKDFARFDTKPGHPALVQLKAETFVIPAMAVFEDKPAFEQFLRGSSLSASPGP